MPTAEYIIQTEHTSGLTAKHYHGESISTLNTWAANNIPANAVISNIEVYYSGKLSLGDTKFYVGYTNDSADEPGQKIISDQLTTSQKSWRQPVSFSGRNIISSYSRINVWMSSGIVYKKFTCYSFKIIWTYSIPTYTITVKAGKGGTVTGGGTYQNQATATLTATANTGYDFVKWSDGITSESRTVSVTGDATYTAEFAPQTCEIILACSGGFNGAEAILSGGGWYKFGDTITINAEIPQYHKFKFWFTEPPSPPMKIETTSATITIGERFCSDRNLYTPITLYCGIEFTGYIVKAEVQPSGTGKVRWGNIITFDNGEKVYWDAEEVTSEGVSVKLSDYAGFYVEAIPEKNYKFLKWGDGNTENPRNIELKGDTTFTAIFRKLPPKFNSASMKYMDKQISASNKVICNEGFIISVEVT